MNESNIILEVEQLNQYFRSRNNNYANLFEPYLRDVSFKVYEGEILGIVGESGCGKSTLGKCIAGLFSLLTGNVYFKGEDITNVSSQILKDFRKKVQIIFQNPRSALNMNMRINELMREAVQIKYNDKSIVDQKVDKILSDMQLLNKKFDYPHQLSGGERRRAGLGRILSVEPELIIADEPVSSLDVSYKGLILDLLLQYKKKKNATLIFISHDIHLINQISQRVLVMFLGKLVEVFNPNYYKQLSFHHPYTRELYDAAIFFKEKNKSIDNFNLEQFEDTEMVKWDGKGCPYYPRCQLKNELPQSSICRCETPPLIKIDVGEEQFQQKIACHYFSQK